MELEFGNYRVNTDTHNWMLQVKKVTKEGKKAGEETWETWGYWGTLDALLKASPDLLLRRHSGSPQEAVEDLRSSCSQLSRALQVARADIGLAMAAVLQDQRSASRNAKGSGGSS